MTSSAKSNVSQFPQNERFESSKTNETPSFLDISEAPLLYYDYMMRQLGKNKENPIWQNSSILEDIINTAGVDERSAGAMENSKILEMYMDKVNQDQAQLRQDIRASEERTSARIVDIEKKMDARLNRIEDMIGKSNEKIDANNKHIQNITISNVAVAITVIVGIITIFFSVYGMLRDTKEDLRNYINATNIVSQSQQSS